MDSLSIAGEVVVNFKGTDLVADVVNLPSEICDKVVNAGIVPPGVYTGVSNATKFVVCEDRKTGDITFFYVNKSTELSERVLVIKKQ